MHLPIPELREGYDEDGVLRVTPLGELDLAWRDQLRARLGHLGRAYRRVRLDLAQLRFIDSSGVEAILGALAQAHDEDWDLEVERLVSPSVERIAALTGVSSVFWPDATSHPKSPLAPVVSNNRGRRPEPIGAARPGHR